MSAIITDQIHILNAKNFVSGVGATNNSYYFFVGLPNPTDINSEWNNSPPDPIDNFDRSYDYWDTIIGLKKIYSSDISQVVRKYTWASGETYGMYKHDISYSNPIQIDNRSLSSLYLSRYYIVNKDYRVYICLNNGTDPDHPGGRPSLDEPLFTDLEPRPAGSSDDGYIWKYLYTISPSDLIKFDSTNYITVPSDWNTNDNYAPIRNNASNSGQIKIILITNRGSGLTEGTYPHVPINGDGNGGEATVIVNNQGKVESVTVSNGGSGYTFGTLDLVSGGLSTGTTAPSFNVIIPPPGGHGKDIYRELGAVNVLLYSRISTDELDPDFIIGNQIARIGIIENPTAYGTSDEILQSSQASGVYALRLTGVGYSIATFSPDSVITQTVGVGSTAIGRVISYDQTTGVLKYWQDRTLSGFNTDFSRNTNPSYGFKMHRFTSKPGYGGNLTIVGGDTPNLSISTSFTGLSTSINNRIYRLGQYFNEGVSNPEVQKYSGNIIYVDNRPAITRSTNQKEDIKVVLQF